jgi:hypothetical protein
MQALIGTYPAQAGQVSSGTSLYLNRFAVAGPSITESFSAFPQWSNAHTSCLRAAILLSSSWAQAEG